MRTDELHTAMSGISLLSTFPQARSSTDERHLTSLFTESIHRFVHRTLAWHPGAGVMGACSHAGPESFATVDLPAVIAVMVAVEYHRVDQGLVSFLVSFTYVRTRLAGTTYNRQPRSQTLVNYAGPGPTDLESVWGPLAARPDRGSAGRVVVWAQFWSHSLLFTPVHQRPRTARPGW